MSLRATKVAVLLAGLAGLAGAACSLSAAADGPSEASGEGDAGVPPRSGGGNGNNAGDAAPAPTPTPAGEDAATAVDAAPPVPTVDAGESTPDAGASPACTSNSSIQSILTQFGSDDTASTVTPMGARFVAAAQAGPISAANAAFLTTASSNPAVATATSATGLEWQTVPVKLYPAASGIPSPEDIMQHAIGDCDGDSALASLAYVNPSFVKSLIEDNGDGTFAVAMFDPMGKPITVTVDSEVLVDTSNTGSLGQVSASDGSADWATVLEKAVMKYDYAYGMVGQIDGIGSEELVPMFTGTGGSIAISPGSLTPAQFQQVLTVSLAAGKLITGGFHQVVTIGQDETVTAHGYAMMVPTDPTTDMADMRNPWGMSPWASSTASGYDTSADGLLQIPLATTPTNWPAIIDLRIIDPGPECTGVTTPFVPLFRKPLAPIHLRESHAKRAR